MATPSKQMEIGVLATLKKDSNPLAAVAEFGLKTAQLQTWNMDFYTPEMVAKVKDDIASSKIRLAAFWAGYSGRMVWNNYVGPSVCGLVPRNLRQRRVDDLKRGADFAKAIGAPAIITHAGFIPDDPMNPLYEETVTALHEVAKHCLNLGIGFWFETGQETPITLLRVITDIGFSNLGINLDTANLIMYGRGNPVDALEVFGPYVRNLHIKDAVFATDCRFLGREVAVGEGRADFDKIIKKLYELDFTGELIIEREISGPQQAVDIKRAQKLLTTLMKKYKPTAAKKK